MSAGTLVGAAAGLAVLAAIVTGVGVALTRVPVNALRAVVEPVADETER
jgi:uncharacterized membrane protein